MNNSSSSYLQLVHKITTCSKYLSNSNSNCRIAIKTVKFFFCYCRCFCCRCKKPPLKSLDMKLKLFEQLSGVTADTRAWISNTKNHWRNFQGNQILITNSVLQRIFVNYERALESGRRCREGGPSGNAQIIY